MVARTRCPSGPRRGEGGVPQGAPPCFARGIALARAGDPASAIRHHRRAIELDPEDADAYVNWGNALVRAEQLDAAITQYAHAVRLQPRHADAYHNWGVALARQGKLDEAITRFERVLSLRPDHAEAGDYLRRALQFQREKVGAPGSSTP